MLTQKQEVDNKSKKQESQENNIQLIVARSNATKLFDSAEKTLDLVPSLVKLCIIPPGVFHVSGGALPRPGDRGSGAVGPQGAGIIAIRTS